MKFHRGSLNYIHESLRSEKVNFALVLDGPEFEGYDRETICKGYFRLYKNKSLKKSPGIIVDHLENGEVVELGARYKERYGKNIEILDSLSGWAVVLAFVELGQGTGYLPDFIAKGKKRSEGGQARHHTDPVFHLHDKAQRSGCHPG